MDSITRRALGGAISVEHTAEGGRRLHVQATNLTLVEAEQLGALLAVEARAARAASRRRRLAHVVR